MAYKNLGWLILLLAAIGLADAIYLTAQHFSGVIPPCSVTGGCETVLTSRFAVWWGVPVAGWGVLYYSMVLILAGLAFLTPKFSRVLLFALVCAGVATSAILIYLQGSVLNSWCLYCLISAGVNFLIFSLLLGVNSKK